MNFKKNALKTAVAAAGMAAASSSMAGTWTAATTAGGPVFATELFGAGNTTVIDTTTAVYTLGTGVTNGSQNITYTLTGGTWGGTGLSSGSVVFNNVASAKATHMTFALVDGGTNTDSTASFRVTTLGTNNNPKATDRIELSYDVVGVTGLGTATTTGGPTLAFSITDTLGNVDTAGAATVVASSANGTTTALAPTAVPALIDVSNGSTQFTGAGAATLAFDAGSFTVSDLAGAANGVEDDGTTAWAIGTANAVLTSATVTVTGDFSASLGVDTNQDTNTSQGEGVTLSGCVNKNATTLTATTATFSLTTGEVNAGVNTACDITINADGTTVIPESSPTVDVSLVYTGVGYADESISGALAAIRKDGSTQAANLLLNPTGAYDNFIRISNTGGVAGAVFATITNDAGESATFTLVADLAAGASTDLISVDSLYASAQAADATFDVGTGKLRGSFTGEFAGINVQNISTSTDGTTFFTF